MSKPDTPNELIQTASLDEKLKAVETYLDWERASRFGAGDTYMEGLAKTHLATVREAQVALSSRPLDKAAKMVKYRDPERPGKWYLTDFTMEQVEGRLAYLEKESARLRKENKRLAPENRRLADYVIALEEEISIYKKHGSICE